MGSRHCLPVSFWKQMAVLEMQLGILMLKTTSYYKTATEDVNNLIIFAGHDWENETETILFTGLDAQGHSGMGKEIN